MSALSERLTELMTAMGWQHQDLMAASRQSSSVVSQWLGKGSKEIKSIGKMEAAIYLERASGFSALWIAKGIGPKRVTAAKAALLQQAPSVQQLLPPPYTANELLERMSMLLATVPFSNRSAVGDVMRGWAIDGGAEDRIPALLALLAPLEKRRPAA